MARVALALMVVIALAPSAARADEWVTPTKRKLTSKNKRMEVEIVPAADGRSGAKATISELGKPGATFRLTNAAWMPVDALLFDDGTLLAFDNWHNLGFGKVATLYERTGQVRWARTLEELLGKAVADQVPHSVSSAWWRRMPLESTLAADGKTALVTLFDENQLQIALQTGASKIVAVADLPDDPDRLVKRAKALVAAKQEAAALPLLDRVLAKDPDYLQALDVYIEALQHTKDHARVAALLDRMAPKWTRPFKNPYDVANVCVAWAASMVELARPADAERALRIAMQATPDYPNPHVALARLLIDQKRAKDGDKVLDDFVARLAKQASPDTYAIAAAGDFYKQRGEPAKALAHYLKAYKPTEVTNQFLYTSLAEVYERLGKNVDAIRIHEQLLAHYTKLGSSFDDDADRTRTELTRLRAVPKQP